MKDAVEYVNPYITVLYLRGRLGEFIEYYRLNISPG